METVILTCKYFKFGSNTTGLSQSHFSNFLNWSIIDVIKTHLSAFFQVQLRSLLSYIKEDNPDQSIV